MRSQKDSVSVYGRMSFLYGIGACPKCMHQSFLFMMACTVLFIVAHLFKPLRQIDIYISILFAASVALWALHLVVYAFRRSRPLSAARGSEETAIIDGSGRRAFFGAFFRFVGSAIVITMVPSFALADTTGACPQLACRPAGGCSQTENYCCPYEFPSLNPCNCQCYKTQQDVTKAGCREFVECYS